MYRIDKGIKRIRKGEKRWKNHPQLYPLNWMKELMEEFYVHCIGKSK
jgi:hypothetical protein